MLQTQKELTIKSETDLRKLFKLGVLSEYHSVCLTDKLGVLSPFTSIELIRCQYPEIKFNLNYSAKLHTSRKVEMALENFTKWLKKCDELRVKQVLVVSGNPKPAVDTLRLLEIQQLNNFDVGVAFNPFLNSGQELERLKQKLKFAWVKRVYFQLGDDLKMINKAIELINKIKPDTRIYISILQPTEAILNSLRFRPWHGIGYSEKFLNDLEFAQVKTIEIKEFCENNGLNQIIV